MSHFARILLIAATVFAVTACSGESTLRCEDPALYATSGSIPPIRVPDGLNIPDESDSLQIPSGEPLQVRDPDALTECLESPPDFADDDSE